MKRVVVCLVILLITSIQKTQSQDPVQELLLLLNDERMSRGIPPLTLNETLSQVALEHSKDMMDNDYFAHTSLDGRTPAQRVFDSGYYDNYSGAQAIGENLTMHSGEVNVAQAHTALMESSGHRENILNPNFNEVGMGIVTGEFKGSIVTIYTQVFCYKGESNEIPNPFPNEVPVAQAEYKVLGDKVVLDASSSYDPDGKIVLYQWFENGSFLGEEEVLRISLPEGEHVITLKVIDERGASSTKILVLVVEGKNKAPVADAGEDMLVEEGEEVILDGASSEDDSKILLYEWFEEDVLLSSEITFKLNLTLGVHILTLKVTDDEGLEDTDEIEITVYPKSSVELEGEITNKREVLLILDSPQALEMSFSQDGENFSEWEPYKGKKFYILEGGDGEKTIWVRFKNNLWVTPPVSTSVVLDIEPPRYIKDLNFRIEKNKVYLSWSKVDDAAFYKIYKREENSEMELIGKTQKNYFEDSGFFGVFSYSVHPVDYAGNEQMKGNSVKVNLGFSRIHLLYLFSFVLGILILLYVGLWIYSLKNSIPL
ncbi:MAG: CAP domain-containing protein [Candidatus Methanofastidiosia archaeon]